jgi:hypothetical protein
LLPVPEAAPETPVANVEAPVIVWEESVELPVAVDNIPDAEEVLEPELLAEEEEEEELEEPPAVNVVLVVQGLKWVSDVFGPKHTDGLAGVLAGLLEPLGGGVFVVTAVLGEVAGHLVGLVRADVLDVGRVLAGAARLLVRGRKRVSCGATGASYLTAARRHAGGAATATRAATAKTARKVEAFASMLSDVLWCCGKSRWY